MNPRRPQSNVSDEAELIVTYSGEAIAQGLMDLSDLIPALNALRKTIISASFDLNHGSVEPKVLISAETRVGSYEFVLVLVQTASHPGLLDAVRTSAEIGRLIFGDSGLVGLIKFLFAAKGKEVTQNKRADGSVEFKVGGLLNRAVVHVHNNFIVPEDVARLYARRDLRAAFYPAVEPVTDGGIHKVRFAVENDGTSVTTDDVNAFLPETLPEPLRLEVDSLDDSYVATEEVLDVIKPSFADNQRWKFGLGNESFGAVMSDMEFQRKVHGRQVLFGDGDKLRVILHTRRYKDGKRPHFNVAKVLQHLRGPEQLSLG